MARLCSLPRTVGSLPPGRCRLPGCTPWTCAPPPGTPCEGNSIAPPASPLSPSAALRASRPRPVPRAAPASGGFLNRGCVLPSQTSRTFRVHIPYDPQAMLHVIKRNEPAIKHQHRVVEPDIIFQPLGQPFDQPHHVVAEITNGPRDQRRQSGQPYRLKLRHVLTQERDRIALFPHHPVAAL